MPLLNKEYFPYPLRPVRLFKKYLQKAPGKCTVSIESREPMPINDSVDSTLRFLPGARPSSCRLGRAPVDCIHKQLLRIGLVKLKSPKELFLRLSVERIFRSNIRA